jgi:hypothetical protein
VYLIQILLPRVESRRGATDDANFTRTREELVEQFSGVTA